jgi:hypothetical protein
VNSLRKKSEISFRISSKKKKQQNTQKLGINLTKEMKDMYNENYKTLKKKIKEPKRSKDLPCSWIGRNNITKWPFYQK